jgi:perosamine synthetase
MISFFADKTITTGEGAAILINDEELYEKTMMIRNQGRKSSGTFIHEVLGMNFRMTDLQCAVGVAQIKKFEKIKRIKLRNYALYKKLLRDVEEIEFLKIKDYTNFVPFRVNVMVKRKEGLMAFMEKNRIQTRGFFYPLHRQPCFRDLGYKDDEFQISNLAFDRGTSLPVFCSLKEEHIEYVCGTIERFYDGK